MRLYIVLFIMYIVGFCQQQDSDLYRVLVGHKHKINYLRFSKDGKYLASGGWDNTVVIWDVESFTKVHTLCGHTDWIREIAISPDNKYVASASHDGSFRIWNLQTGKLIREIKVVPNEILHKSLYPEFDRKTNNAVCALAFSPDSKSLTVGTLDEFIRIWDLNSLELIKKFKANENGVGYISYNTNGDVMISGSINVDLIIWDVQSYKPIHQIKVNRGYNCSFQLFNNDKYLINAGNDSINVWKISDGSFIRSIPVQDMLQSVQITQDEKYMVTCGEDHLLILWDYKSGKEIWRYKNPKPELADCKISPDGKLLALATPEGKILIWKISDLIN